jgi:phage shock protein A
MLKIFTTLIRGAAAEAEEAVFDANAIRVLEQQLRDAAGAMELSRRELACAMAHRASEARAAEAVAARIAELEGAAGKAIQGGREDLAEQAATVIAANEDELAARQAAIIRFDIDISRLRSMADTGRQRLQELRRGLEMARAQEALHRAGANGRRALKTGTGALRDAEATLARIREAHAKGDDLAAAMDDLEAQASGRDLTDQLAKAGFGQNLRTKPGDVLARLKAKTTATGATGPQLPPKGPYTQGL